MPIALCVGLGMMTKLSAWMVAPAIAIVFLCVFIRNIKRPLPFIGQFAAFGGVCAPLGLWWGIRNLIAFNIPITYVPNAGLEQMSVESVPAIQRLFDLNPTQFAYPYDAFTMYNAPYNEYNPLVALFKTSLFDEYRVQWDFSQLATAFVVLVAVAAIVSLIFLALWMFKKDSGVDLPVKLFFAVIFVTVMISYYLFCFEFPYVCTENIRYCIPVIPILAIGLGYGVNRISGWLKPQ